MTSFASKESARRKALDSRMQRVPVESSSIASIGYAPQERVLELEFRHSGEVYQYFDVPAEEYTAFLAVDSKGTYVNQQLSDDNSTPEQNMVHADRVELSRAF